MRRDNFNRELRGDDTEILIPDDILEVILTYSSDFTQIEIIIICADQNNHYMNRVDHVNNSMIVNMN
jgi:hypothetical protein